MQATSKTRRQIAERWTGRQCYLDGALAIISGRLNDFATVSQLNSSLRVEFAWETVERIMYGKMEFSSR